MDTSMTVQQAVDQALSHLQSGRLNEAEAICRAILSQHPDHLVALQLLGQIAYLAGRHDAAVQIFSRCIEMHPTASAYCNLGSALAGLGKMQQAVDAYQQAIALRPDDATAHSNLGHVLLQQAMPHEAVASLFSIPTAI
jgi:tetratricopeptide (TPR) repeat protein